MADKPKSFETFYFSKDGQEHYVHEVQNYYDIHKGNISYFEGKMFCPECERAELSFTHKTSKRRAYLSRKPTSSHELECSYNYEYASSRIVELHIKELTPGQIKDKLEAMMNALFRKHISTTGGVVGSSGNKKTNPLIFKRKYKDKDVINAFKTKSLNTWIDETDGTDFYIFYGKVKFETEMKQKIKEDGTLFTYYILKLLTLSKSGEWKYRTSIYRGYVVDTIERDTIYYVTMIGKLKFFNKFIQIELIDQSAIFYRSC